MDNKLFFQNAFGPSYTVALIVTQLPIYVPLVNAETNDIPMLFNVLHCSDSSFNASVISCSRPTIKLCILNTMSL